MKELSYITKASKKNEQKKWFLLDAQDQVVGRLATRIAVLIRGKHKPSFSPHVDCGDRVIVINTDHVRFTGDKWKSKRYIRHTGYPGGQRSHTPEQVRAKFSARIIEHAVKGMLPKNRLGRVQFRNLHAFAGATHPYDSQKPVKI